MQKLANMAGLKNASVARVTWNALKRKIINNNYVFNPTGLTPRKRTTTAAAAGSNPTPSKKARGHAPKKMAAPARAPTKDEAEEVDDDEEEEKPVKKEPKVKHEIVEVIEVVDSDDELA